MLQAFADGKLFGARFGDSKPWILALHGWQRSSKDFVGTLGALANPVSSSESAAGEGSRDPLDAIALDLPGFGAAPPPADAWGTAQYAEFISAVLDEMADQVVVLGHSYGAIVATQLAVIAPQRVRALVLTGAPFFLAGGHRPRPSRRYQIIRRLARLGVIPGARLERARERYGSADYRAAAGIVRAILVKRMTESDESLLAKIDMPVELIWGQCDTAATVDVAKRAFTLLPHANLEVLSGVDHFTPLRAPEALRAGVMRHRP